MSIKTVFFKTFLSGVVLLIMCVVYAICVSENITYNSGAYSDFHIGETKKSIFEKLPGGISAFAVEPTVYFLNVSVDENLSLITGLHKGSEVLMQTRFYDSEFYFLSKKDIWKIYFEGNFRNYITFKFCGDLLCEIHRVRQVIELP